jgi:uncharacterized protein YxjI
MMSFIDQLRIQRSVMVQQQLELGELFGFETRNKFSIENEQGTKIGFAAEQQKGFLGLVFRQLLGHWRTFEIHFFDEQKQVVMKAVHPFRFFFQRLEISMADGTPIGAIQQRFAIFSKKFDVHNRSGSVTMSVRSPFWRLWTFPFMKGSREVARVEKRWSGILTEALTDKDKFRIQFTDPGLTVEERLLLLASGVFIDLQYFEKKAD